MTLQSIRSAVIVVLGLAILPRAPLAEGAAGAQSTPTAAQNVRSTTAAEATGYVTDSVCAGKLQRIDVRTSKGTVHLRPPASGALAFEDTSQLPEGFNACKSLKGQRVSVQYAPDRSADGTGTIMSIRLLPPGEVNSADGPIAPVAQAAAPAADSPLVPDAQMTAEGRVTDVTCKGNDIIVKVLTEKRQFTLHTRDYTRLNFDDDRTSIENKDFPACTDLKGRVAAIDFIVVAGKPYDGEMRNVEIER